MPNMAQLAGLQCGVRGDQHQAGERCAVLDDHPIGHVGRPEADAFTRGEALQQPTRTLLGLKEQFGVGPAPRSPAGARQGCHAGGHHLDQRRAPRVVLCRLAQGGAGCEFEQWHGVVRAP